MGGEGRQREVEEGESGGGEGEREREEEGGGGLEASSIFWPPLAARPAGQAPSAGVAPGLHHGRHLPLCRRRIGRLAAPLSLSLSLSSLSRARPALAAAAPCVLLLSMLPRL